MSSGFNMRSATMPANDNMSVTAAVIDEDFIPTMGIELVAGSNLSRQDIEDASPEDYDKRSYHFIINESAVKELGWKSAQEAVGQKMFLDDSRPGIVKGVAKDFHFQPLHTPIRSIVLFPDTWGSVMLVKLKSTNVPQTLAALETKWKQLAAHRPFSYRFLDEDYNKMYSAEIRLSQVMNLFTIIAIALACMGLFGLSYYAAQQRKKEIGVRKVLGASVLQVSVLVSKEFLRLVLVAFLIAVPATWWAMSKWLEDFAYRTNISWSLFAIAGVAVLLIAAITVSFEAIKAALANPVKSLRSE
jgi:putative ABC transport system permease protein